MPMKSPEVHDSMLDSQSPITFEDSPDELARLTTLLGHARGGTWVLAIYESAIIQKQIIAQLRAALSPLPVLEERLGPDRADPLPVLRALPSSAQGAQVVCLTGVEEAFPALFGYLDLQRELLALTSYRLILWITEYGWRELAEHAPNFYSRLSGVFHFPGLVLTATARITTQLISGRTVLPSGSRLRPPIQVQDEQDRERRLALLQRRATELTAMAKPDVAAIAGTYYDLGTLYEGAYRLEEARVAYAEAARWYARTGQEVGQADALYQTGRACYYSDRWIEAGDHFNKALTLYRLLGDVLGEANVLQAIGDVQSFQDERDAALQSYQQALGLFRQVGARLGEANVLKAIGDVQYFRKENDAALQSYQQALGLFRQVGDRLGEANVLKAIGDVQS